MIYYVVSICVWALLIYATTKTNRSMQVLVGTMIMAGAIYALAQLLKM